MGLNDITGQIIGTAIAVHCEPDAQMEVEIAHSLHRIGLGGGFIQFRNFTLALE
jgi:hypothetical protein